MYRVNLLGLSHLRSRHPVSGCAGKTVDENAKARSVYLGMHGCMDKSSPDLMMGEGAGGGGKAIR